MAAGEGNRLYDIIYIEYIGEGWILSFGGFKLGLLIAVVYNITSSCGCGITGSYPAILNTIQKYKISQGGSWLHKSAIQTK